MDAGNHGTPYEYSEYNVNVIQLCDMWYSTN